VHISLIDIVISIALKSMKISLISIFLLYIFFAKFIKFININLNYFRNMSYQTKLTINYTALESIYN